MSVMSYELVYISSVIPQRNLKLFTISPYLQNNFEVLKNSKPVQYMHLASNKRRRVMPSHKLTTYEGGGGSCVWWLAGQRPNSSTKKNEDYP